MSIKEEAKKVWDKMSPDRKRYVSIGILVTIAMIITTIAYYNRTRNMEHLPKAKTNNKVEMAYDAGLLEKSQYREQERVLRESNEQMKKMQQEIEDLKKEKGDGSKVKVASASTPTQPPIPGGAKARKISFNQEGEGAPNNGSSDDRPQHSVPPPPFQRNGKSPNGANGGFYGSRQPGPQGATSTAMIGDIEIVTNMNPAPKVLQDGAPKKKIEKIYLPPSYMEASLLSGLDAPTTQNAKGDPVPVLIRIKNLAQLPNRVKADLKGCFAIADGVGSLADERAHLRVVSITCLSKNGTAVIDQKVKGFVVDEDGKIGLKGTVVAKYGAMLARGMLSGFFGGLGDGLKAASQTNSISALGATTTINSNQLAQNAVGSGIAEASHDLQKFYLKLAESTLPVIEIGAARDITLVIEEGVDLEIKNFCGRNNTLGDGSCGES